MQKLEAVFSDVDGTLLRDDKSLSDKHLQAIQSLHKQNIKFVIVTGRGPMGVYSILDEIGVDVDIICYSGAYSERAKKKIHSNGFTKQEAIAITNLLNSMGVAYGIFSEKLWISPKRTPEIELEESLVKAKCTIATIDDIDDNAIVNKFLVMSSPDKIDAIIANVRNNFPNYDALKSLDYLLELNKGNCNKGVACVDYCKRFNIDINNTLCFGDCYNDLEMLRMMPNVCIMANAPSDIKYEFQGNKNKIIIESNMNDGIYHQLKRMGYVN